MNAVFKLLIPALVGGAISGGCAAEDAAPEPSRAGLRVSRDQMGKEWPLSVAEGEVSCEGTKDYGALFFTRGARRFALNGVALTGKQAPDIKESGFLMPDPTITGSFKSIGPLMDRARSACK